MIYLDINQPSHPGGPRPQDTGWLYISYDARDLGLSKIGITKRAIFDRIFQSTTNPFYMLFAAFRATGDLQNELRAIEKYFTKKFRLSPLTHPSGQKSEWWSISPQDALLTIVDKLSNVGFGNGAGSWEGWDFTQSIYFPKIDPYSPSLALRNRDELVRVAAPDVFLNEIRLGQRPWPNASELFERIQSGDASSLNFLHKPLLLIDKLNYYRAFWVK